jgi:predicted nuclease with RNAse H fold
VPATGRRTAGIDLAAQPENTALCVLEWNGRGADVVELRLGADDAALVDTVRAAAVTAIDAPFGWPEALVAALDAWRDGPHWPQTDSRALRFRATDLHVREMTGIWPLSPSADRIAVCAWRCARVLSALGVRDRLGGAGVIEAYPAGALKMWELPWRGYKPRRGGAGATSEPGRLLEERAGGWLRLSKADWRRCREQHDLLDSLVCALVARAAGRNQLLSVPVEAQDAAAVEGWIQLPRRGSLERLA